MGLFCIPYTWELPSAVSIRNSITIHLQWNTSKSHLLVPNRLSSAVNYNEVSV